MSDNSFDVSIGAVRMSQVLYNHGPGSIVDFMTGSFMPLGLDYQEIRLKSLGSSGLDFRVREERLERLLEVRYFQTPPTPGEKEIRDFGRKVNRYWAMPAVRFPEWMECPQCNRIGKVGVPFELQPDGRVKCMACNRETKPVRFIVLCPQGHIQDFPWLEYAHRKMKNWKESKGHRLFLRSEGKSAALSDLYVECIDCKTKTDLGDIFKSGELQRLGIRCWGNRPWLGRRNSEKCSSEDKLRVSQRGGSNTYFPVIASMLSIPPASDAVAVYLRDSYAILASAPPDMRRQFLQGHCENIGIPLDVAMAWFERYHAFQTGDGIPDEAAARYEEYLALSMNNDEEPVGGKYPEFQTRVIKPADTAEKWFGLYSAVERLREVRVLCGFTRLEPTTQPIEKIRDALTKREISPLSEERLPWLPGIEIRGEGIFLRFNQSEISHWLKKSPAAVRRAEQINEIYNQICIQYERSPLYKITPQLLLVHSFAHVVIRRLSLDCGYSSASLRERLFVSEPDDSNAMAGVLIYTGSADSDGSLGGLVHLATSDKIEDIIRRAIEDASWCANDPVCAELDPNLAGDRLSGASCHSCLLLPETSCERYNKDLDRIMLVGTPDGSIRGFFHDMVYPSDVKG